MFCAFARIQERVTRIDKWIGTCNLVIIMFWTVVYQYLYRSVSGYDEVQRSSSSTRVHDTAAFRSRLLQTFRILWRRKINRFDAVHSVDSVHGRLRRFFDPPPTKATRDNHGRLYLRWAAERDYRVFDFSYPAWWDRLESCSRIVYNAINHSINNRTRVRILGIIYCTIVFSTLCYKSKKHKSTRVYKY